MLTSGRWMHVIRRHPQLLMLIDSVLLVPVAIGGVRFTCAHYDAQGDLLYLTKGIPLGPADGDTREGHPVFFGENGRVIGVLIMGARWHLDRDGTLNVTLRDDGPTTRLSREVVEPLLVDTPLY